MKKRTLEYLARHKAFASMHRPKNVKSLLVAEFHATKNLVVKRDILKTLEGLEKMGKSAPAEAIAN